MTTFFPCSCVPSSLPVFLQLCFQSLPRALLFLSVCFPFVLLYTVVSLKSFIFSCLLLSFFSFPSPSVVTAVILFILSSAYLSLLLFIFLSLHARPLLLLLPLLLVLLLLLHFLLSLCLHDWRKLMSQVRQRRGTQRLSPTSLPGFETRSLGYYIKVVSPVIPCTESALSTFSES